VSATSQIINARIPGQPGLQQIILEGEPDTPVATSKILGVFPQDSSSIPSIDRQIDLEGDWCSFGGVDLQINGALGLAFPDLQSTDGDKLREICDFLWQQGVDGFLPTLVTTSIENFQRSMGLIAQYMKQQSPGTAQILGVHLEGPCLNPEKRGAHPKEYLLPLTLENIQRVIGDYESIVKVVTLASELDPTDIVATLLCQRGIVVSLGHSQATHNQAIQAFDAGATMVTHAFNAMPALHHRQPGLLGAALTYEGVRAGFIADGQHIHSTMLELFLRAAQFDRHAFLVSDALSPLGLPDGFYPWDRRQIEVRNGTARLPDGTLAGTTLSLLKGVDNLVQWGVCSLEQAIILATVTPRQAINLSVDYPGQAATLLRWRFDEQNGVVDRSRLSFS
jgi:N-acetylglucosamine-6-phosphate deacetylase